jgi:hypothetical protein
MSIPLKLIMLMDGGESMQLAWHYLVNLSFGYLILLATVRLAQELSGLVLPYRKPENRLS